MYTYLLINLFSLSVPLLASFDSRIALHKKWKLLFPSIFIASGLFILWDVYFTSLGIWGFNEKYILGIYLAGLPIEEWMFFICIPYACIFTYESLNYIFPKNYLSKASKYISLTLIVCLLTVAFLNLEKAYTATTFLGFAILLIVLEIYFKAPFMGKFYQTYIFLTVPFMIVNGILTGTGLDEEVVWYNNAENLGIRILTIPIEDTFYGMFLILLILSLFKWFQKQTKISNPI